MRNTNKYTKLYSGGVPKFTEDNIFEIEIPINNDCRIEGWTNFGGKQYWKIQK